MKKLIAAGLLIIVVLISVLTVSAYFDQDGTKGWCNSDADGCWVTGEDGEKIYIMFWSEASREKFMGKGSSAPLGDPMPVGEMALPVSTKKAPAAAKAAGAKDSCVCPEYTESDIEDMCPSCEEPVFEVDKCNCKVFTGQCVYPVYP